jgi:hypothetical protein
MAFPPAFLPSSRQNTTATKNTHPNDHNKTNVTVNDIIRALGAELLSGTYGDKKWKFKDVRAALVRLFNENDDRKAEIAVLGKLNTVRSGSGAPSSGTGKKGDFYVNTSAWTIYGPKDDKGWGPATSLRGATGRGQDGAPGRPGGDGAPGKDGRIRTVKNAAGADVSSSTLHFKGAGVNVKLEGGETIIDIPGGGGSGGTPGTGVGAGGDAGGGIGGSAGGGSAADLLFRHAPGTWRRASVTEWQVHNGAIANAVYMFAPLIVTTAGDHDALRIKVPAGSAKPDSSIRVAMYKAGANFRPHELVRDLGQIDTSSAGMKILTADLDGLQPGLYWEAFLGSPNNPSVVCFTRSGPDGSGINRAATLSGTEMTDPYFGQDSFDFGTDFLEALSDGKTPSDPFPETAPDTYLATLGVVPVAYIRRKA